MARGEGDPKAPRVLTMLVLPTLVLSTEYIVPYNKGNRIILVGTDNSTDFSIKCTNGNGDEGVIDEIQTYFLNNNATSANPVSCNVLSNKPVAVFMGRDDSDYVEDYELGSSEQAIPVSGWGQQYIVPGLPISHSFGVSASQNGTNIDMDHRSDNFPVVRVLANRGELRQTDMVTSALALNSNKPITVMQYGDDDNCFMTTVPAVSQFANDYTFFVPDVEYKHYVTIIVSSSFEDGIFIFDEMNIPVLTSKSTVSLNGDVYTIATLRLKTPGQHRILLTSTNNGVFGGIVHGLFSSDQSIRTYAHPLGMLLKKTKTGIHNMR